jgi:hypothetical protein
MVEGVYVDSIILHPTVSGVYYDTKLLLPWYTGIHMMSEDTSIRVSKSTWRSLHERKEPGDSMDDVLAELLDAVGETGEPAD